jgi:hypothetical protein
MIPLREVEFDKRQLKLRIQQQRVRNSAAIDSCVTMGQRIIDNFFAVLWFLSSMGPCIGCSNSAAGRAVGLIMWQPCARRRFHQNLNCIAFG